MDEMNQNQELDLIEMTDDEGNTIVMQVVDYFFYNGEEYVILSDNVDEDEDAAAEIDCYIMHVVNSVDETTGEEMEEFEPVEDAELEERLIEIATNQLNDEEEPEA